jgi:hypothetical protein
MLLGRHLAGIDVAEALMSIVGYPGTAKGGVRSECDQASSE